MRARVETTESQEFGVIELGPEDGYHVGTVVSVYVGADGSPVVQIDTPTETETHELIRVRLNDAIAAWRREES